MATLGGVTCTIIKNTPPGLKDEVVVWRNPGFDGYGAQNIAAGQGEFDLILIHYDTKANIATWIAAIEALSGTVVSLVFSGTEWDQTYSNVMITGISVPVRERVIYGGNTRTRCMMRARCIRTA